MCLTRASPACKENFTSPVAAPRSLPRNRSCFLIKADVCEEIHISSWSLKTEAKARAKFMKSFYYFGWKDAVGGRARKLSREVKIRETIQISAFFFISVRVVMSEFRRRFGDNVESSLSVFAEVRKLWACFRVDDLIAIVQHNSTLLLAHLLACLAFQSSEWAKIKLHKTLMSFSTKSWCLTMANHPRKTSKRWEDTTTESLSSSLDRLLCMF